MESHSDPQQTRILIADDDPEILSALADLVATERSLELVAMARDGKQAAELALAYGPDVAIIDWRMPHGGGPRALRDIRRHAPQTRLIAMSVERDRNVVLEMLQAGATSFIVKNSSLDQILSAIRNAVRGQAVLSPEITGEVVEELVGRMDGGHVDSPQFRRQRARVEGVIERALFATVFQPIFDIQRGHAVGVEALTRFTASPRRPPDVWFAEASAIGMGAKLEVATLRASLRCLDDLPSTLYLSLNMSPGVAVSEELLELLEGSNPERIVIEVTEHDAVDDYDRLKSALSRIRARGTRIAIDDAGAGFASLSHVLQLHPDLVKLDPVLCRNIHEDQARAALTRGLVGFAAELGAEVLAEGIEKPEELVTLKKVGVRYGQGYLLGRPSPLPLDPVGTMELTATT